MKLSAVQNASPTPCFDENVALDLVDGQLAPAKRQAALAHAESCDACRLLLKELAGPAAGPRGEVPRFVGEWELLGQIGAGAAGTVHRARHVHTGMPAAVKLMTDPQLRMRFTREVRALASLSYPGIVRYYAHGTLPDGTMYLVMQWLDGPTLEQRLEQGPALSPSEVIELGVRLAYSLAHAHARGCVHRDLSPKNIILHGGQLQGAMIVDFGLVRWVRPDLAQTASQAIVGTPYFMAPEQIRGEFDIDARADLFALGVVLFVAASGKRPFEGPDLFMVWQRIVHSPHPDLSRLAPHMPRGFVEQINHLLEKAPADRPVSAEYVARALGSVRFDQPPSRGRMILIGSVALLLVGGVCVGAYALGQKREVQFVLSSGDEPNEDEPTAEAPEEPADPPAAPPPTYASPTPSISPLAAPPPKTAPGRSLTCMRDVRSSGKHYLAENSDGAAVTVMSAHCTLEDCIIEGTRALTLMGGVLTLRRCTVRGDILFMNANAELRLEGSTLDTEPSFLGDGAVEPTRRGAVTTYRHVDRAGKSPPR